MWGQYVLKCKRLRNDENRTWVAPRELEGTYCRASVKQVCDKRYWCHQLVWDGTGVLTCNYVEGLFKNKIFVSTFPCLKMIFQTCSVVLSHALLRMVLLPVSWIQVPMRSFLVRHDGISIEFLTFQPSFSQLGRPRGIFIRNVCPCQCCCWYRTSRPELWRLGRHLPRCYWMINWNGSRKLSFCLLASWSMKIYRRTCEIGRI